MRLALFYDPPGVKIGVAAAILGIAIGIGGALVAGGPTTADAAQVYAAQLDLREAPLTSVGNESGHRPAVIADLLVAGAPERLPMAAAPMQGRTPPKLVIIFDDMGIDHQAFERVMTLPGPVTLSFLPYAKTVQPLVDRAQARGDAILLHLPMEPSGVADAGPHAISASMSAERLFRELAWNLDRFDGFVGVNNHMGSKATRDEEAMKRVLSMLDQRGLFFIDSLTTGLSAVSRAGDAVGAEVYVRDVFLDAEPGRQTVRQQLALAEEIASKTGYAIVICHPRPETLDVIGPWLTTALARGYELSTVTSLREIKREAKLASAAP